MGMPRKPAKRKTAKTRTKARAKTAKRKAKAKAKSNEEDQALLEAPEFSMSAVKLQLRAPEATVSDTMRVLGIAKADVTPAKRRDAGWIILNDAVCRTGIGTQIGEGAILSYINGLRKKGYTRFMTKDEKTVLRQHARTSLIAQGDIKPTKKAKTKEQKKVEDKLIGNEMTVLQSQYYPNTYPRDAFGFTLARLMEAGLRAQKLSSYIFSSVANTVVKAEFSKDKLYDLLSGRAHMPVFVQKRLQTGSEHWKVTFEERYDKKKDKTYINPVIEIDPLFTQSNGVRGALRLHCYGLKGKPSKLRYQQANLSRLAALGPYSSYARFMQDAKEKKIEFAFDSDLATVSKGALKIQRKQLPGHGVEWWLQLPIKFAKTKPKANNVYVGIRQGISTLLSVVLVDVDAKKVRFLPSASGYDIVQKKRQFSARRSNIQHDIANRPRNGRGDRRIRRAIKRLGRAEANYVDTAAWLAVKQIQTQVLEPYQPKLVVIGKLGGTFNSDIETAKAHYLPSYVHHFPFAKLGTRLLDVCHRRTKTDVSIMPTAYKTCCPACGHTDPGNIKRLPRIGSDEKLDHGEFVCVKCGVSLRIDTCAALNTLIDCEHVPEVVHEIIRKDLQRLAKIKEKVNAELAQHRKTVGASHQADLAEAADLA